MKPFKLSTIAATVLFVSSGALQAADLDDIDAQISADSRDNMLDIQNELTLPTERELNEREHAEHESHDHDIGATADPTTGGNIRQQA